MAFAILASFTSFVAQSWSQDMEKAGDAISRRRLREAADTCFRRILYEIQEHDDGMSANVADFYARDWLKLEGREADRYRFWKLELRKKLKTAAGTSDNEDAEDMFGDGDDSTEDEPSGEEEGGSGVTLMEVTLDLRHADEDGQSTILTLKTYIRPPENLR